METASSHFAWSIKSSLWVEQELFNFKLLNKYVKFFLPAFQVIPDRKKRMNG